MCEGESDECIRSILFRQRAEPHSLMYNILYMMSEGVKIKNILEWMGERTT